MTNDELAVYYANLLIAQYKNLDRASNTAYLLAEGIIANQVIEAVNSGFDITTAIGPQLDILASYVKASRVVPGLTLSGDFFNMNLYTHVSATAFGFADYSTPATSYILSYSLYLGNKYAISDELLRLFIMFRAISNTLSLSLQQCDDLMYYIFGSAIGLEDDGTMGITYTYTGVTDILLMQVLDLSNSLPKPAGVGITVVYA
jgi:hypothetical protein